MVSADGERGQLILIGAILVATTILGSIVLLNSIHESPAINTQQDAQSLSEAQRTVDQLQSGLERAFLVNTSMGDVNESLPYANKTEFDALAEAEYAPEVLNLSTTEAATVVNVTLVDQEIGGIARQNKTIAGFQPYPAQSGEETLIDDAEGIPRLHLLVNNTPSSGSVTVWINETTPPPPTPANVSLKINDTTVETGGPGSSWSCDVDGDTRPIEIDFVDGVGEVRTGETYCGNLEFGTLSTGPREVNFDGAADFRGTYTITAVEPDTINDLSGPGDDFRWARGDSGLGSYYIVNPIFEIEYLTPNVEYSVTYAPYNSTAP